MDYEKLLDKAIEQIPKKTKKAARFEVPYSKILPAGARTIIINFTDIAQGLRREPQHLLKFLLKELATKGELKGKRLEVIGRFSKGLVDKKIDLYVKNYVLCPECGKPDTKIIKKDRFFIMKCEACGAKHPIPKI